MNKTRIIRRTSAGDSYEQIADAAASQWRSSTNRNWDNDASEALYKAYKTILDLHERNGTLTDSIKERISNKGRTIRD
ncbi:MAG: hypothetical protein WC216_09390, partial [Gallionella sp.]